METGKCPRCRSQIPLQEMAKHVGSKKCLLTKERNMKLNGKSKSIFTFSGGRPESKRTKF